MTGDYYLRSRNYEEAADLQAGTDLGFYMMLGIMLALMFISTLGYVFDRLDAQSERVAGRVAMEQAPGYTLPAADKEPITANVMVSSNGANQIGLLR